MNTVKITLTLLFAAATVVSCGGQRNKSNTMKNNATLELIKAPVTAGLGTLDLPFNLSEPLYRTESDETPIDIELLKLKYNPYLLQHRIEVRYHQTVPNRLAFRVLEVTDSYYRIVFNESTYETAVVRKDPRKPYIYETWEDLLLRCLFVNFIDDDDHALYDAPEGKMNVGKREKSLYLRYHIKQVQGDWAQVMGGVYNPPECQEGWIKWKNDTNILVKFTTFVIK